ncbi:MAG TPA: zinc ribbon domain-containing protein [Candidatus Acetothermia bacterium]|nr:zinc ribbon domain-containing protein [Candidatus Acetothermia bacterium]
MPLYRYECESCGSQFTVLVRQQAQVDAPVCPECGSKETRRMVPRVAVQFKGSGYYKTDYARKGKGGSAGSKASNNSKPGNDTSASAGNEPQSQDSQSRDSQSRDSRRSESQGSKTERKSAVSSIPAKAASSD